MRPPDDDGFACFELLGYDILLDHKCRPWLLEVNHSPSFCTDSVLDLQVKQHLILDTLALVRGSGGFHSFVFIAAVCCVQGGSVLVTLAQLVTRSGMASWRGAAWLGHVHAV